MSYIVRMRGAPTSPQFVLPKPGPVLKTVLIGLLCIWLVFALGMNWGGVSDAPFSALVSTIPQLASGELWRLLTAPVLHHPHGIGHIITSMIGLYFLSPSLEENWGSRRFARFLLAAGALSYGTQFLLVLILPSGFASKLVPPFQYGALPVVEAIAIAWACSFRGRTVNLMFVLPVSSRGLILFVVGISLLSLIAGQQVHSGHIALFSGMGYGWLLGGGTPSPLRRFYLKYRLARLEQEAQSERTQRTHRVKNSPFQVIPGGKDQKGEGKQDNGKGKDGNGKNGGSNGGGRMLH